MREPRLRSSPSIFHPNTNRRMYRLAGSGDVASASISCLGLWCRFMPVPGQHPRARGRNAAQALCAAGRRLMSAAVRLRRNAAQPSPRPASSDHSLRIKAGNAAPHASAMPEPLNLSPEGYKLWKVDPENQRCSSKLSTGTATKFRLTHCE
jgi:hypothetical protein